MGGARGWEPGKYDDRKGPPLRFAEVGPTYSSLLQSYALHHGLSMSGQLPHQKTLLRCLFPFFAGGLANYTSTAEISRVANFGKQPLIHRSKVYPGINGPPLGFFRITFRLLLRF